MSFSKFSTFRPHRTLEHNKILTSRPPVALTEHLLLKTKTMWTNGPIYYATVDSSGRREAKHSCCLFQGSLGSKKEQIWETTLPHKNSPSIQMPYPKLMVMVSFCWKMNFLPSKIKKQIRFTDDVLEINHQSRCILSGPPCIANVVGLTDHSLS